MDLFCNACGGKYHPATGHIFTEKTRLCGPCAREFTKWVKGQTNRRWGGKKFYDYAFPPKEEGNNGE